MQILVKHITIYSLHPLFKLLSHPAKNKNKKKKGGGDLET
jgi:hypothetical protein